MIPFEFLSPEKLSDACELVNHRECMALAGGTTMLDLMKLNVLKPQRIVSVSPLLNREITLETDQLWLGAGCTMSQVADDMTVKRYIPALRQSLLTAASPQIRNMATMGGNLLQRTRSPYFRHPDFPADARVEDSMAQSLAEDAGPVSNHLAMLGADDRMVGTYPGDFGNVLVAFGGTVHLTGGAGARQVPADAFFKLEPDQHVYSTDLRPGELIEGLSIPIDACTKSSLYYKLRERSSYAFALCSAAVGLELDGMGETADIVQARVGLGGLAPYPWHSREAVEALVGKKATDANFQQAAEVALQSAKPLPDSEYRLTLAKRILVRSLRLLRDQGTWADSELWAMQHGR